MNKYLQIIDFLQKKLPLELVREIFRWKILDSQEEISNLDQEISLLKIDASRTTKRGLFLKIEKENLATIIEKKGEKLELEKNELEELLKGLLNSHIFSIREIELIPNNLINYEFSDYAQIVKNLKKESYLSWREFFNSITEVFSLTLDNSQEDIW